MKLFFTLFALLFISFNGFGQTAKIDSLKKVLTKTNGAERIEILKTLCLDLIQNSSFKQSKVFLDEFVELSELMRNYPYQIEAYKIYSGFLINEGEVEKGIQYAEKAKETSLKTNDYDLIIPAYANLGALYSYKDFSKSIEIYEEAIKMVEKKNLKNSNVALLYRGIGNILYQNYEEEEAIVNLLKALSISEQFQDYEIQASTLQSLGFIFTERKNPIAIKYLKQALDVCKRYNLPYTEALTCRAIGRYYTNSSDFEKAIIYQKRALTYFEQIHSLINVFELNNNIAFSYLKSKNYRLGLEYSERAIEASIKLENQSYLNSAKITKADIYINKGQYFAAEKLLMAVVQDTINKKNWPLYIKEDLYKSMFGLYEKKDESKKAIFWLKKMKYIKDSLNEVRYNDKVEEFNQKYQTEKKEKQIAEQQLQLTKENRNKWFLSGGLIGSLAVLGVVGFSYQRNRKQKKQIENLQKELHHRVKNNLSIIDTFIEVVKKELPDAKAQGKLNELQNRIISINEVHRQLYNSKNITSLYLKKYIDTLAENVSHSFDKPEIELKTEIPETVVLSAERSFPVGLIVNEFLTNSYKYAFENNGTGKIWVSLKEKGNNYLLSLSDNGKGLPAGFDVKETNSFGLRIIKLLTEQLNGNFSMKGDDGVSLEIEFPKT